MAGWVVLPTVFSHVPSRVPLVSYTLLLGPATYFIPSLVYFVLGLIARSKGDTEMSSRYVKAAMWVVLIPLLTGFVIGFIMFALCTIFLLPQI
jgi:hypothetical protein